jgi:hypothetical protein
MLGEESAVRHLVRGALRPFDIGGDCRGAPEKVQGVLTTHSIFYSNLNCQADGFTSQQKTWRGHSRWLHQVGLTPLFCWLLVCNYNILPRVATKELNWSFGFPLNFVHVPYAAAMLHFMSHGAIGSDLQSLK